MMCGVMGVDDTPALWGEAAGMPCWTVHIWLHATAMHNQHVYVLCIHSLYTPRTTNFHTPTAQHVGTFGFRGEAISSLCAVAQVSIITKTAHAETGVCMYIPMSVCDVCMVYPYVRVVI